MCLGQRVQQCGLEIKHKVVYIEVNFRNTRGQILIELSNINRSISIEKNRKNQSNCQGICLTIEIQLIRNTQPNKLMYNMRIFAYIFIHHKLQNTIASPQKSIQW